MDNPTQPQPGDAVRLDSATYYGAREGAIAIIDSTHYDWEGRCLIVFAASAFRGPETAYSPDQTESVSCSGGPCPLVRMADLKPAGTREQRFWRWRDMPRANGGVNYRRTVPLWSWDGLTDLERAEAELRT
jgi:hypothetical protein